jgi:hypothetical protein
LLRKSLLNLYWFAFAGKDPVALGLAKSLSRPGGSRRPLPVVYSVIPVAMPPRRFPQPWSVEETDLAYVYFEDGSHR